MKERVWERFTGKKPDFREQFELMRKEPDLLRDKSLDLNKDKERGHDLFRSR